jgi:hypothetical protein
LAIFESEDADSICTLSAALLCPVAMALEGLRLSFSAHVMDCPWAFLERLIRIWDM